MANLTERDEKILASIENPDSMLLGPVTPNFRRLPSEGQPRTGAYQKLRAATRDLVCSTIGTRSPGSPCDEYGFCDNSELISSSDATTLIREVSDDFLFVALSSEAVAVYADRDCQTGATLEGFGQCIEGGCASYVAGGTAPSSNFNTVFSINSSTPATWFAEFAFLLSSTSFVFGSDSCATFEASFA